MKQRIDELKTYIDYVISGIRLREHELTIVDRTMGNIRVTCSTCIHGVKRMS